MQFIVVYEVPIKLAPIFGMKLIFIGALLEVGTANILYSLFQKLGCFSN